MVNSFFVARNVPESDRIYVLFTLTHAENEFSSMHFIKTTGMFRHNLLILRQPNRELFHGQINETIRGFLELKSWLSEFLTEFSFHRVIFTGISESAYSAIVFGHYLEPDQVIAFSPPTHINIERFRKIVNQQSETNSTTSPLPKEWTIPNEHKDLRELLSVYNGKTSYKIYYCKGNKQDQTRMARLVNTEGVILLPQKGKDHLVANEMESRGLLMDVFR